MRNLYSVVFLFIIASLGVCAYVSYDSRKDIGFPLFLLLIGLLPPVIGNLIINASIYRNLSLVGSYIYYLGMDFVMFGLLNFAFSYCNIKWPNKTIRNIVYTVLFVDMIQLLMNPITNHAFGSEEIIVDGLPYFRLVPYIGQTFHRIVDYMIFVSVLLMFIYKTITSPRINSEKYFVILVAMIFSGLWQTFYIFSRTPIDSSMIGFGIFGLLVFYFSLYYRPLRLLDKMLANIASDMPEALFFFDNNSRCIWANDPGIRMTKIERNDFNAAKEVLADMFPDVDFYKDEFNHKRSIGYGKDTKFFAIEKHTARDENNRKVGSFISVRDYTDEQLAMQSEIYNARHDNLTDLYVRDFLFEKIHNILANTIDKDYYIVYLDVQGFKLINDIYGTKFGDLTLKQISDWLRRSLGYESVYGRISADTYGVLIPVEKFDDKYLNDSLNEFKVCDKDKEVKVNIHAGVYRINESDLDVSVMFDRAHLALETIKNDYSKHVAYYDDEMRNSVLWNQTLASELPDAIKKRHITPFLQPIVDKSGVVVGAEALVRWNHPEYGLMSPGRFVPVLEKNGLICEVDKYMWRCACEILNRWEKEYRNLFISVNISPKDFYFMDVAEELNNIIKEYHVEPGRLRVEITETVMMSDIENRMNILSKLKEDGFIVEMDDFGSGYSSLNLLKDMPVDVLKIDMAFLRGSKDEYKAQTIIHNIINLSEDLGIVSLTEGVETSGQYEMLSKMGCKLFQGYNFSKPIPVEEFEKTYLDVSSGVIN